MTISWMKRCILTLVTALALTIFSTGIGVRPALAAVEKAPWSQTNYNAAASRANLTEHILSPSAVTKVQYLRSVVSPVLPSADCPGPVVAPVLAGGDAYAVTNDELSKYDAATGKLLWRSIPDPEFDQFYTSVSVAGGLVVVGGFFCESPSDAEGHMWAFNAATGKLAWSMPMAQESALEQLAVSGPYVIAAGDSPGGGQIVAVSRLSDGKPVWFRDTQECVSTVVLVVAGLAMSYSCNNGTLAETVTANDLATGKLVWSRHGAWTLQRGDIGGSAGKHLYVTNPSGAVVDLNPLTGKTQHTLSQAVKVLAVDASRAYASCGSQGADVCAYTTATGKLAWQATSPGGGPALAAEADGVLYTDAGAALNAATGKVITHVWQPLSFNVLPTAIAVGDGRIAVASDPRVLDIFGLPGS
jgi:hypothetical protein